MDTGKPPSGPTDATASYNGWLSTMYYALRKIYIPTSPELLLLSQKHIFETFVKIPVAHKIYRLKNGEFINYIDIDRRAEEPGIEKRTLLLTHGYASGLGFFFGN